MIKVKDIMQIRLVTAKQDTSAAEVINILWDNYITGLPVVDDDMSLVGIVSEKDVLDTAFRILTGSPDDPIMSKNVGDIMTKDIVYFRPDDTLADVCQCFRDNVFRRIPVVDAGKLIGLVSRKDVIHHAFYKSRENELHLSQKETAGP